MLSGSKLKELCQERNVGVDQLAGRIARGGFDRTQALSAVKNWQKELYKPAPGNEDVERMASVLGVSPSDISVWRASCRYAPISPRKARLVTQLIAGRNVQDALDVLKFSPQRAAQMVSKLLKSAMANADEQEADVEKLYVYESRVDGAGRRIGTRAWMPKDRGRAHPIRKEACHIHVTLAEE